MDGICEQLVKRPVGPEDNAKKIMILAGAVLLGVVAFAVIYLVSGGLLGPIAILAAGAIIWGGWTFSGRLNVEYEYTVVGQELRVDKIYNQKSRKMMVEMQLKNADAFYSGEKHLNDASEISACGEGERYTIEFDDEKYGKTLLYFTPDERTFEAVKRYLPRLQ